MSKGFLPASLVEQTTKVRLPRKRRSRRNGERGVTLAVTTICFLVFLLATGMAVDVSHFYLAGSELQNAADASALAGASALDSTSAGIVKATDNAVLAMNKFEFSKVTVSISRNNVKFANNINDLDGTGGMTEEQAKASPTKVRFVKVRVPPKDVGAYFAKFALNADTIKMTRTAVAGQSESGAMGDVTPNEICNPYRITLVEGSSSGDGELDRVDQTCGSSFKYTPGCTYNVHLTPPCAADLGYYEIADGDFGQKHTDWDDRIAGRLPTCLWNTKVISAYTHPQANNIKNGINAMFENYGGGLEGKEFPPDANIKEDITFAQYKTAGPGSAYFDAPDNNKGVAGRRVMVLPMIQKNSFVVLDQAGELANMTVSRFGAFFITKKVVVNTRNNAADMVLEYIGDRITVGNGAINPAHTINNSTATGLAVPVLYR